MNWNLQNYIVVLSLKLCSCFEQISFMRSNFSLALPYVAASEEPMENSFVSCIAETCGLDSIINNVAFSESCFIEGDKFQKLADVDAVHVNQLE